MNTIKAEAMYAEEIKKSKFVVKAAPVNTVEAAKAFLAHQSEANASHNCWAYKVEDQYRFNDDGEPAGTAGRPILGSIERQDLTNVVVLVIRYFGGIKLGAGGLARAYGSVAARCLQRAQKTEIQRWTELRIRIDFGHIGQIHQLIAQYQALKVDEIFEPQGVSLMIRAKKERSEELQQAIRNATKGSALIERNEDNKL